MGMNKADILADCIKDRLGNPENEEEYLKAASWVDELHALADPQAAELRNLEGLLTEARTLLEIYSNNDVLGCGGEEMIKQINNHFDT